MTKSVTHGKLRVFLTQVGPAGCRHRQLLDERPQPDPKPFQKQNKKTQNNEVIRAIMSDGGLCLLHGEVKRGHHTTVQVKQGQPHRSLSPAKSENRRSTFHPHGNRKRTAVYTLSRITVCTQCEALCIAAR